MSKGWELRDFGRALVGNRVAPPLSLALLEYPEAIPYISSTTLALFDQ